CGALGVQMSRPRTGPLPYPEQDRPTRRAAVRAGWRHPSDGCGPLRGLVEELLAPAAADRPAAADVQIRLRALLAAAPEPYGPPEETPLLPAVRVPAGPPARRARRSRAVEPSARTARPPLLPPALLGPLLVGGVLLTLLAGLAAVVLASG
ncbi:hypothetical protein ACFV0G_21140, partial [Kitasatospora sp. NPDC059571]